MGERRRDILGLLSAIELVLLPRCFLTGCATILDLFATVALQESVTRDAAVLAALYDVHGRFLCHHHNTKIWYVDDPFSWPMLIPKRGLNEALTSSDFLFAFLFHVNDSSTHSLASLPVDQRTVQ